MTMQFLLQCIRSRLALSGHAVTKRPCPLSGPIVLQNDFEHVGAKY
jgi:hypothetical protein